MPDIPDPCLRDQYVDGVASSYWDNYVGDFKSRKNIYKEFLLHHLSGCERVLDAACGTGVDSVNLLEEGFNVTSIDLSDNMLKYAREKRWERRKERFFDDWIIKQADWANLENDLKGLQLYDGIVCLGNSFTHIGDEDGTGAEQRNALRQIAKMLKPGGVLIIDHRNYDYVLEHGKAPSNNVYYKGSEVQSMEPYILYQGKRPILVALDYTMKEDPDNNDKKRNFRLSVFPHRLKGFNAIVRDVFGPKCLHDVYADYKPLKEVANPSFYIHVIRNSLQNSTYN